MTSSRRDPDAILAQVHARERQRHQGVLRIYFGYAPGVGKTYAMLTAAQAAVRQGRDLVVGYIEPHTRPETLALLEPLEIMPVREIEYRGIVLREFDVDAVLKRHPEIVLVDELAHSNAVGCRHGKRWQDIEELIHAGINVWSTLNVQHIESLNDVIGQITGVLVRETIPDHVFDLADELELVDITPDELLVRLEAGKIYVPDQAQRALHAFFQKANLSALRELSLRQAARRVHNDVESARRDKSADEPWATTDRLLVCVGPSPTTARVIRTAKRMSTALDAPWTAVSVDLTGEPSESSKQRIAQHFRLAERLGAEVVTLAGQDIADTLLAYARTRNVTKILIGKTHKPRWRRFLFGTVVDNLLDRSGDIDIHVIRGEPERPEGTPISPRGTSLTLGPYILATGVVAMVGMGAYALRFLHWADTEANTVMLFLAAVAWNAFKLGRGPAILASVLAVLIFDFYFVPPHFTFAVSDTQYLVTFGVMLTIGLLISTLTARLRAQIDSTRQRERRTYVLYELGKQLSSLNGQVFLCNAAGARIAQMLGGEVAIYLARRGEPLELVCGRETELARHALSYSVAQWVTEQTQLAGAGTNTLPNAIGLFFPLEGSHGTLGAMAVRVTVITQLLEPDQRRFLEACASQLALALERDNMTIAASEARVAAEAEQVRSTLLSSVSHDLKTPLASIAGASSSLLASPELDESTRRMLLETVGEEAVRLNRLLDNILQMSRLDAGAVAPNRQWHVLEEIIGTALHRVKVEISRHHIVQDIASDFPLIYVDGLLFEQVFTNLLENAARYTPPGTVIRIHASIDSAWLRISVADNGPGVAAGNQERIFEKFFRATPLADGGRGSGLGLAICRAILQVHGGTITARNGVPHGIEFILKLPVSGDSPQVVVE